MSRTPPPHLLAAVRTLAVDAMTAEAVQALDAAGCPTILLKGPAIRDELYSQGGGRAYVDADLLVAPAGLDRAASVLVELGFELVIDHHDHVTVAEPHAQEWRRPGGGSIDLHWRIAGAGAPPSRAWELLDARTVPLELGKATARRLDRAGIAVVVALHAAHHGRTATKPLVDLAAAVEQIDRATWSEAAELARALGATEAFAAGLRLDTAGAALAGTLGLTAELSAQRRLMASSQPGASIGLLRLLEAREQRMRVLRETLFPKAALMRASHPLARRGAAGLSLAYAGRLLARARQLPAAVRAVRSSRRPPRRG